ncbi:MAG: Esterase [Actinomycetia bacterium]|nr:Esterase [Actinomycetes bacterium]
MLFRRSVVRRALAGGTAVLAFGALALVGIPAAGAAGPASNTASAKAVGWIKTQQQPDGGFEVAGASGFETRDAALAIAETAQTSSEWNPVEARNAVTGTVRNGKTALDYIATTIVGDPALGAGNAAKTIVLTTAPLGLDPTNFAGVNLVAKVASGAHPDGSYGNAGALNDTLYAALADRLTTGTVPAATVAYIRSVQQSDGDWGFDGNPATTGLDPDTTSAAIQALVAGGVPPSDPAIRSAVAAYARSQNANGSWDSPFQTTAGAGDPNSTGTTIMGLTALGIDVTNGSWKAAAGSSAAGYVNPDSYLIGLQQPDGRIASQNDAFPPINTFATTQAVEGLQRNWLPVAPPGYQVVRANGHVTGLGGAPSNATTWTGVVGAAATNSGHGTWLAIGNGGVITEGDAPFFGSMGGTKLAKPVVGVAPTPSGRGYWLVAADGGIFSFGDARYFVGLGAIKLDQPVVGIAATPTGNGYTLFASDGGVFAFGDATFKGSMGGIKLAKPVVGGASTQSGKGYWMVASDGGIFTFGDAPFAGSLGALKLAQPIMGMQHTGTGKGYWLVGADGGVFTFGGAPFFGAAIGEPASPVVAIAS